MKKLFKTVVVDPFRKLFNCLYASDMFSNGTFIYIVLAIFFALAYVFITSYIGTTNV